MKSKFSTVSSNKTSSREVEIALPTTFNDYDCYWNKRSDVDDSLGINEFCINPKNERHISFFSIENSLNSFNDSKSNAGLTFPGSEEHSEHNIGVDVFDVFIEEDQTAGIDEIVLSRDEFTSHKFKSYRNFSSDST